MKDIESALVSALTQFDAKQFARTRGDRAKGYNPYALGIYFNRIDDIMKDVEAGADVRAAIVAGFTGKTLAACLKALNLSAPDSDERAGANKSVCYTPVKAIEA